jgi:hypothetical protein
MAARYETNSGRGELQHKFKVPFPHQTEYRSHSVTVESLCDRSVTNHHCMASVTRNRSPQFGSTARGPINPGPRLVRTREAKRLTDDIFGHLIGDRSN